MENSQVHNLFENMKNFPLQLSNSPGNNNFGNLPNPLLTPNFAASKSVENFESMDNDPLSPSFAGSNNFLGDNALFGGGSHLDDVNLRNSMGNGNESPDFSGKFSFNENGFNSKSGNPMKGNGFNQVMDNNDQTDGPMSNPFSDYGGQKFDESRIYESRDDMWNGGQYDAMPNYGYPNSYYDNGNSWLTEDYNGYRRLVVNNLIRCSRIVKDGIDHEAY
jgi:hypothetical protein